MSRVRLPFIVAGLVAGLAFLATKADAQTVPAWDQDLASWTAPTQCVGGAPLTGCPITGYRVEEAASVSGPWGLTRSVGPDVLSVLVGDRTPGSHCYRVRAESKGPSAWSDVKCATTTAPKPARPTLSEIDAP